MDVAAEVVEQMLGRAERLFGVDVPTFFSQSRQILFDHFIRPHKYTWRNCKAEDLACFQVNDQVELC